VDTVLNKFCKARCFLSHQSKILWKIVEVCGVRGGFYGVGILLYASLRNCKLKFNLLKPCCNYMYHLLWHLKTLHVVTRCKGLCFMWLNNSMAHSPFEGLTGHHLFKKFPESFGTGRFITALTTNRHLSLSWAGWIQSYSLPLYFFKLHCHVTLPPVLRSSRWLFPSGFPSETLYVFLFAPPLHTTCSAHFVLLDLRTLRIFDEDWISWSASLSSFL